ncbi:MAG: sugar ABC transporter ATP-binding protein [Acetobacteraceae bacterium]
MIARLPPQVGAAGPAPTLSITGLSKTFSGVKVLDDVSLTIAPGEVYGLLGQNGSGKSTLIKILAGFYEPDNGGSVSIAGRPVELPVPPGGAARLGMSFVHQNLGLLPSLTVLENFLIADIAAQNSWSINWQSEAARVRDLFSQYHLALDPASTVSTLGAVQRALLAIVRAFDGLNRRSPATGHHGLLILDEPTPFLPSQEVGELFRLIHEIAAQGASIIFVSHDIDEVLEITHRGTVLRDGRVAGVFRTATVSKDEIVQMIVGRHIDLDVRPVTSVRSTAPWVTVRNLSGDIVRDFSIALCHGEIVGLTGLIGSGYDEVLSLLYGASHARRGTLLIDGKAIDAATLSPTRAIDAGCIFIPGDRVNAGAVATLSVIENVSLPVLGRVTSQWAIDGIRLRDNARGLMTRFAVRPPNPSLPFGHFSGGNQQKVLLAKWLQLAPRLILLDEPTQGVDVGAREQVFDAVREMAESRASIVCASSDYEQLTRLADRVIVFGRGRATLELRGEEISKAGIAEACYRANELSSSSVYPAGGRRPLAQPLP